ncbi:hypothetical protein CRUP_001880, partial [Coryphaenoides rupestris]
GEEPRDAAGDHGNHGNRGDRPPSKERRGGGGGERVRTTPLISPAPPPSPPQEEDDLDDLDDLDPPAPGIFNLDFDPMSFQCSPPFAIPGPRQHGTRCEGSKKSAQTAGTGSEPPVSSPHGQALPSLSKLRKSFKTHRSSTAVATATTTAAAVAAAATTSTRANVTASSSHHQGAVSDTPPPVPTTSPPSERCEARRGGQHCSPLSSQSSAASALTDLSQPAQNLPDPGADRLVSSVSVLPPHPPLTSAARKLALALAESAQKATEAAPQRRTTATATAAAAALGPSYASPPAQRPQDTAAAAAAADRTPPCPRPSVLHLQAQYCGPRGAAPGSPLPPSEGHPHPQHHHHHHRRCCCPHPTHQLLPTHRCSPAESPLRHEEQPLGGLSPNVSPLGSGSLEEGHPGRRSRRGGQQHRRMAAGEEEEEREAVPDDTRWAEPTYHNVGVSTPTQPTFCSAQSPSGGAVYANADSVNVFNFRTVLAETAVPGSVGEVLPRPPPLLSPGPRYDERVAAAAAMVAAGTGAMEDVYGHHHGHRSLLFPGPGPAPSTRAPSYPRPDALPFHLSRPDAAYKHSAESRYGTLGPRHPLSPQYGGRPGNGGNLMGGGGGGLLLRVGGGQWERPDEGMGAGLRARHPAMRRARSFHAAPHFSHEEIAEAEVVPPEALYYIQRPPGSEPPYRWLLQSDFQPARFEGAHVGQYGYGGVGSPYGTNMSPSATDRRFYADTFRPGGIRHSQSYTLRSTVESTVEPDYYQPPLPHPLPHHHQGPPLHRDLFVDRREAAAGFYEAREVDSFGRRVYKPVWDHDHDGGQYNSPTPPPLPLAPAPRQHPSSPPPADGRGREIMHTRSRSDPGNACLFSGAAGAGGLGVGPREAAVVTVTALQPGSQPPALRVKPEVARQPTTTGPGPTLVQEPAPRRRESVPRRGLAHDGGLGPATKQHPQRPPSDPRRGQPPLRKVPSLPERIRPQPRYLDHGSNNNNSGSSSRSQPRGRQQDRVLLTNAINTSGGCGGGQPRPSLPRRAGRSQSIKENRRYHHHQHQQQQQQQQQAGPLPRLRADGRLPRAAAQTDAEHQGAAKRALRPRRGLLRHAQG